MGRKTRVVVIYAMAAAVAISITSCIGFWDTPLQLGKLIVSDVVVTGSGGYVLVSVADMPGGGLASIQFGTVGDEAIDFTNIAASSIEIEGQSGFVPLAQDFTTNAYKGSAIAANAVTGIDGGVVLKFTFTITGSPATFTIDATKVSLGSHANAMITGWELSFVDYYTQ